MNHAKSYYLITKHPNGGYAAIMCYEDADPEMATRKHRKFNDPFDAYMFAQGHHSDLGVKYSDEVKSSKPSFGKKVAR